MTEPATEILAQALRKAEAPQWMVQNAKTGVYDDFKSSLDTPQVQLRIDALSNGLRDIADRVLEGEFDASKEEADRWFAQALESGDSELREAAQLLQHVIKDDKEPAS